MSVENRALQSPEFPTSQHNDAVDRPMLRVSDNRGEAENVVVDALLKAYRQVDPLRDPAAIAAPPPRYRSVYGLRDIEDRPGDEVAHPPGISGAAMTSGLDRARELIRNQMDAALRPGSSQ